MTRIELVALGVFAVLLPHCCKTSKKTASEYREAAELCIGICGKVGNPKGNAEDRAMYRGCQEGCVKECEVQFPGTCKSLVK